MLRGVDNMEERKYVWKAFIRTAFTASAAAVFSYESCKLADTGILLEVVRACIQK